jgi:hypothetical protein
VTANFENAKAQRTFLIVLSLALLAWGTYHAVGSYFGGIGGGNLQHDFRRSLVVFACMAAFLGFWWILLLTQPSRSARTDRPPPTKKDGSSTGSV